MPSPEELMFQEARSAIQAGNRARARDLLTRLLKTGQDNPEIWLWMSAVVETPKERIFCLNQALKLDPLNASARRGLAMMGAGPVDESQVLPGRYQRRNWQSRLFSSDELERKGLSMPQLLLIGAAFLVVVVLLGYAALGQFQARAKPTRIASLRYTRTPTLTLTSTVYVTPTGTLGPTPLALRLEATYTPTPLYVNTLHPVNESYRAAMRAYGRGEWPAVRRLMTDLLTAEPDAVDALYYIGESYRAEGNYAEALEQYNQALEKNPQFAAAFLGRARAVLDRNPEDVKSAQADLERAITVDGNFSEAYLELALLHVRAGQPEAAIGVLQTLEPILPFSPLRHLYLGMAYLQAEKLPEALRNAETARDLDITLLPAYRLIGQVLQARGDLEASLDPLTTYTWFEKGDAEAWAWMARAQLAAGQSAQALESLDQSLAIDARQFDALIQRGNLYLEKEAGNSALDDFRSAQRLQALSFDAGLGMARSLLLLDRVGESSAQFTRAAGLAQTDRQKAELLYWRGQAYETMGEMLQALKTWQALAALKAGSVPTEWAEYAQARVRELTRLTPTVTLTRTPTSTDTRVPTATLKPTITPVPSRTPSPAKKP